MILSGLAFVIVGLWLTLQALGGNLAGRLRRLVGLSPGAGGGDDPTKTRQPPEVTRCVNLHVKAGFTVADAVRICLADPEARP